MITTNKVTSTSDLSVIKKYIKNINVTDSNDIISPRLSKSKSYLRILGILYFIEDMNIPITLDIIKKMLQSTYIFNDVILASRPCIIKAFLRSDIAII